MSHHNHICRTHEKLFFFKRNINFDMGCTDFFCDENFPFFQRKQHGQGNFFEIWDAAIFFVMKIFHFSKESNMVKGTFSKEKLSHSWKEIMKLPRFEEDLGKFLAQIFFFFFWNHHI
jgi:hypothetical protein